MSSYTIQSIVIYPIKSLGGFSLSKSLVEPMGLEHDRRFMLVDESNNFITQRTRPELTRFQLESHRGGFQVIDRLTQKNKFLSFNPLIGSSEEVRVWDDQVVAHEVLEGWSVWFSHILNQPVRLVQMSKSFSRIIKSDYQTELSKVSSFADSLPILVCSEASFEHIYRQLNQTIDWRRFRPNIIVSNVIAFEEDTWNEITIGSKVKLFGAKPCARCQLINVNPNDGISDVNILLALSQTRKFNHKVYFGQQFVPMSKGEIKLGDEIVINKLKNAVF
jgi:uncharacterized protein YcbX